MRFDREMLRLYAVTDRAWVGRQTLSEQIEDALRGGVTLVQLREKNLAKEEFVAEAKAVLALCRQYGVPLIINDRLDVALESGADGVHVGIEDAPVSEIRRQAGPDFIIGATAKTVAQAKAAQAAGADYLGVGAVFSTSTKPDAADVSLETLSSICRAVSIPVVAIGGIKKENLPELAGTGIAGVAVVSAIFAAPDIRKAAEELRQLSEAAAAGKAGVTG